MRHRSARTLISAILALLVICSTASAEIRTGVVRGDVIDASGGVLPGVTVVATATDARIIATEVTDAAGGFVFSALPPGTVRLMFQLEGFDPTVVRIAVLAGAESHLRARLEVAPLTESVVVSAKLPVDPPRPLRLPPPPPPPPLVVIPVPSHDRDSICGPAKPDTTPESFGTIRRRRDEGKEGLYTTGDELLIDGGTLNGLAVGRNLVVRRYYRTSGLAGASATGEHSSGLLQIVTADERASVAVVVYACDELMKGDFLSSFTPEQLKSPDPAGIPLYEASARVLFADAGSTLGVPRRLMVIDRGREYGLRAGQRLTLFRRRGRDGEKAEVVGDAIVVAVRADSATIRVERATDAIVAGDWAAPQRKSLVTPATTSTGVLHP